MINNQLNNAPLIDSNGSYISQGYQILNGNPLIFNIMKLLRQEYGQWLYDPNTGSKLYTLENARGTLNQTQISQMITQALQPLITENKMSIQSITLLLQNGQNIIQLKILDNKGNPIIINLPNITTIEQLYTPINP